MRRKTTNQYEECDGFLKVITKKGDEILVDECDAKRIREHSWCINAKGYPVSYISGKVIRLHRFILNLTDPDVVADHKDGNPLNNRRDNIRVCTQKENARNKKRAKNKKMPIGIQKTNSGKYKARIMVDRREINLGTYENIVEAQYMRNLAELRYFGEFAPCLR